MIFIKLVFTVFLFCLVTRNDCHSQSYSFDIFPYFKGSDQQGRAHIIAIDSNYFYIIGDSKGNNGIDTVDRILPILVKFDFNGNLMNAKRFTINDTIVDFDIYATPIHRYNGKLYLKVRQGTENAIYKDSYFIQLNPESGEVEKNVIIEYLPDSDISYLPSTSHFSSYGEFLIGSRVFYEDSVFVDFVVLDSEFYELNRFKLYYQNMLLIPSSISSVDPNTYKFVGTAITPENGYIDSSKMFFALFTVENGLEKLNFLPTSLNLGTWQLLHHAIKPQDDGTWILGLLDLKLCPGIQNCAYTVPYIVKASSTLDEIIWSLRIFNELPKNYSNSLYFVKTLVILSDNSGYVLLAQKTAFSEDSVNYSCAVISKCSRSGDSLWIRKVIPMNWDFKRVGWVDVNDAKEMPNGNIVVAGTISDFELQLVRPWIFTIDGDGCLVPGCAEPVATKNPEKNDQAFIVYPNPASYQISILSRHSREEEIRIQLLSIDGQLIRQTRFPAFPGHQYTLPLQGIAPGSYVIQFIDSGNQLLQTEKIIVQ